MTRNGLISKVKAFYQMKHLLTDRTGSSENIQD